MSYSPAPLALDRSKPSPWNVERAFINLDYQDLWRDLYAAIPLWDTSGEPFEIVGRTLKQRVNGPVWTATPYGPGLSFDGSNDYLNVGLPGLGSLVETSISTFVVRTDSSAQGVLAGSFNDGSNLGYQIWANTDETESASAGKVYAYIRNQGSSDTTRGATTSSVGINDGAVHIVSVFINKPAGDIRIVVDGLERPVTMDLTETGGSPADFEYDLTVGARMVRGTIDNHYTGDIIFAAWHSSLLPVGEIERWHDDIWGLFRPNWDYVTAAFDPANFQTSVTDDDVTLSWDASF